LTSLLTSSSEHTAASSSHKTATFSTLPTELRLIIWNLARPDPRIVRIRKSNRSSGTYSRAAIPNLLHVCQESRQVALEWYQLSFGSGRPEAYTSTTLTSLDGISKTVMIRNSFASPRTYFDFSRDVLFAGCEGCGNYYTVGCSRCEWTIHRDDRKKVSKLLIQYGQESESELRNPFGCASDWFPEARDIMIFSPSPATKISKSEKQWTRLYESSVPLPWQK
jgi:hypothetical protein